MRLVQRNNGRSRAVRHIYLAGAFGAKNFKAHHVFAILQGQSAWLADGVNNPSNLVQPDMASIVQGNVQQGDFISGFDRGNGAHRLLGSAHIAPSTGGVLLHLAQLARHIEC